MAWIHDKDENMHYRPNRLTSLYYSNPNDNKNYLVNKGSEEKIKNRLGELEDLFEDIYQVIRPDGGKTIYGKSLFGEDKFKENDNYITIKIKDSELLRKLLRLYLWDYGTINWFHFYQKVSW